MNPTPLLISLATLVLLASPVKVSGQASLPPGVEGPDGHTSARAPAAAGGMATRSVSEMTGREQSVQAALASHDANALKAFISPTFVYRTDTQADGIDVQRWLTQASSARMRPEKMSVDELGGISLVSFTAVPESSAGQITHVIDVWSGEPKTLAIRFEYPTGKRGRAGRPDGRL